MGDADCDVVIETLVQSEADLLDRVVDLTVSCEANRMLARQALHALHAVMIERYQLGALLHRLLDERRSERKHQAKAA
jgi:hypothetical protein